MDHIIDRTFAEWTENKTPLEARIAVFEKIRDIPYAVIPELVNYNKFTDILRINKGSCTPKHFLLGEMYKRIGLSVFFVVYPFRWDYVALEYPPYLEKLAKSVPMNHHIACRVDIEDCLVLVDATVDLGLEGLGIPVNKSWDGIHDTLLPLEPLGEEEFYDSSEAALMESSFTDESLIFYQELNVWLESVRKRPAANSR
ncbi:MAG: hypothetical protein AB2L12_07795 [Smithellaceae bacterium]